MQININGHKVDLPEGVILPGDVTDEDYCGTADSWLSNDVDSLWSWKLPEGDWLHVFRFDGHFFPDRDPLDPEHFLASRIDHIVTDPREYPLPCLLVSWEVDPTSWLEAPVEGEDVAIWCTPNYYPSHNNPPLPDYLRDERRFEIRRFASIAEAQEVIDHYYNDSTQYDGIRDCNVLRHGQAGSDKLRIVAAP